ncbi:MAG: 4Fe-4S dicluster domain-containing protein [Elusimicrobiota bacterium]
MKYILDNEKLEQYIQNWAEDYRVFVPGEDGEFTAYDPGVTINWETVPVWGGIKEFVFPPRYQVVGPREEKAEKEKPVMLIGVRNCDLRALTGVYDKIFLEEDPVDPVYKNFRDRLKIVSVDCNQPADTCFCSAVGGGPFNEGKSKFDINLTFLKDKIILDTGNSDDSNIVDTGELSPASESKLNKKEDLKNTAELKVKNNFKKDFRQDNFGEKIRNNEDPKYWKDKSSDCMQCGGCNFSCPTCYCNVLNELSDEKKFQKLLQWDSCQFPGYARVGGGGNPREELWQRFRHRYYCKFYLMPEEFEMAGCTGCGRCIQTCPGEIDIRDTVEGLL